MSFRDDSRLDPSQVQDERGRGGVGRGGIAIGGGGLGVGVIIILLLVQALGGGGGLGDLSGLQEQTPGSAAANGDLQDCVTGADANTRQDCRIVGYVNSVQSFWTNEFARRGRNYEPAATYFESGQWQTGCGAASTDVGPFYCPADKRVYLDLGFLDELHDRFGATGGSLAQGYVDRPRVRPPRAGSARHARPAEQHDGRPGHLRSHRAAGGLLRRRVGRARDRVRAARTRSRPSRSRTPSTRRRPSVTIASRARPRARSTPTSGRTAPPSSARTGSRRGTRPAT